MSEAAERHSVWHVPKPGKVVSHMLLAFAGAVGVAIATMCVNWFGGIVSRAELNALEAKVSTKEEAKAAQQETTNAIGALAETLKDENIARRSDREMLVVEMRRRVGLQALVSVTADPKRRATGERIAAAVRLKFDELVQGGEQPTLAAEKALEASLLERR